MKSERNPWMKFYPADWRADPALRSCTIAARGLWVEMLCIMHEATPYGSLLIKSQRIDKKRLASLCGIQEKECVALLLELEGFGVFGRDDDGTIYSRRMRRDFAKAEEGRKQVAKRWGSGNNDRSPNRSPTTEEAEPPITLDARSQIDTMGSAGASGSAFTPGSKALASAFWKALGYDTPLAVPPEFAGVDWRAIEWERSGWTVDMIEVEARRIGPKKSLNYHEKVFATAFAKRQAPLPVVEIREAERTTVTHGKNHADNPRSGSLIAAIDRRLAALEIEGNADPSMSADNLLCLPHRSV